MTIEVTNLNRQFLFRLEDEESLRKRFAIRRMIQYMMCGFCPETVVTRLLRFWETRNVKKGREGSYRVLCTEKAELIETGSGCATYPALMGSLPACSDLTSVGVVRYRVELSISDGTESAVFFVFYAKISWLTNVRAAEISELRSVQQQLPGAGYPLKKARTE
ncbi:hypothetical protein Bca52824_047244 [Brassica carinata]|uniref:Uncharacterized protein n=1 Tax=Brassica carinata TaxID=52824 RepID=A0A8X7UPS8_BRACI|nr:hypothetical protein Bca52824_047244 [Brassica carinata]